MKELITFYERGREDFYLMKLPIY